MQARRLRHPQAGRPCYFALRGFGIGSSVLANLSRAPSGRTGLFYLSGGSRSMTRLLRFAHPFGAAFGRLSPFGRLTDRLISGDPAMRVEVKSDDV
jgi:hypothetical protein